MQKLGLNEIREKYLAFFESKGHLRMPSFSLVPKNDPSLLLINAGMAPLKPYFTGAEIPPRRRVTTCQKCIRTPDIENVGKTARHGTFFEMLGNFSFGDYFKKEAIAWAWEFLTQVMEIPKERLYVTVYEEDDEAYEIWKTQEHVPESHILRMGKADNFWEHGTGPCGPCSEIHYDRGEKYGCGKPTCGVGCDCDRYIEIWNLVFTQFDRQEDGSYLKLQSKNIDTGMGLERLACVMQDVDNLFEVDTVRSILDTVCAMSGKTYGDAWETDVSIRVITDHIRSTVMMIGDGVVPSNEGRGYVLRRLLRGAARHGRKLGIQGCFLSKLAETVIALSGDAYPVIAQRQDYIRKVIRIEEERFAVTIEQGMNMLAQFIRNVQENMDGRTAGVLPGALAFKLHDTYGFPLDLTRDILRENGLSVDEEGFRKEMTNQRNMAREAIRDRESSWGGNELRLPKECPVTEFLGYESLTCTAKILYILQEDGTALPAAGEEENVVLLTDKTAFYGESGGQIGDCGLIETDTGVLQVRTTTKTKDGIYRHIGVVIHGSIASGDSCEMKVDRTARLATARNHSATHLLQKALRTVLGDHVHQAGSSVTPERLRFDFHHMQAMTREELQAVETMVNNAIYEDYTVSTDVMPLEEAKKTGAMALFDEKYGDTVRVVRMGDYSVELCGGTHVRNTASIGIFKIVRESGVAAGVRRIEAVTGQGAHLLYVGQERILADIVEAVKASQTTDVLGKIRQLTEQYKAAQRELEKIKMEGAAKGVETLLEQAPVVKGVKLVTGRYDLLDGDALRDFCERVRSSLDCGVVLAASAHGGKVSIVAMATKSAVEAGVHCGRMVKAAAALCGGGGGGRPDMAQAGGKNIDGIDGMLAGAADLLGI